jgi:Mrp family chromosome partitioning ATPase
MYEIVQGVAEYGVAGYASNADIPIDQLQAMLRKGKALGDTGTEKEFKALVSKQVWQGVNEDTRPAKEKVQLFALLDTWNKEKTTSLVSKECTTFDPTLPSAGDEEFLFPSEFNPLDTLIGGIPTNSFSLFIAKSGVGKTSILLALANSLAKQYKIVFVSYEMSSKAVRFRAKHLSNLSSKDVLLTGSTTIEELEEYCNEDTIIIVDYLALVPSAVSGELRHKLAHTASELLRLSTHTKAVISAHQARRDDKELSIDSLSEAYAISWYASLIVGIDKQGISYDNPGCNTVRFLTLKNRYGKANNQVMFPFNYATLEAGEAMAHGDMGVDLDCDW